MELIGEEEKKELLEVIEGGWLNRYGSLDNPNFKAKVYTLEKEFAAYMGTRYALGVPSGTIALLVALSGSGIGPGDEVIVPAYTFIATVSSVIYARAIPILCEIDETLNMDPEDLLKKITPRTKAVIPVHMLGNPARMKEITAIAKKHKLIVIEDVAQACGGSYQGKKLGSIGQAGTYSFNIFKTITSGDGGMVVTDDEVSYKRFFAFHDQGHFPLRQGVEVGHRTVIGLDFRMNEVTGAVALAQLRKLDKIIAALRENKRRFKAGIRDIKGLGFREITDEDGECATLLTLILPEVKTAQRLAKGLGTDTLDHSGWHVYNNWEHVLSRSTVTKEKCPFSCPYYKGRVPYRKGMCPKTDDILSRAINISIGVSDKGLGASFGITIKDDKAAIDKKIEEFRRTIKEVL
jgi:dTDP-4-amino-4,6-dideoxygalactose transaminase